MSAETDNAGRSNETRSFAVSMTAIVPCLLWATFTLGILAWWMWARKDLEVWVPFFIGPGILAAASLGLFFWALMGKRKTKGDAQALAAFDEQARPVVSLLALVGGGVLLALALWMVLSETKKIQVVAEVSSLAAMGLIFVVTGLGLRNSANSLFSQHTVLQGMLNARRQLAITLMVVGVGLAVLGVIFFVRAMRTEPAPGKFSGLPEGLGMFLTGLVLLAGGGWLQMTLDKPATIDTMRKLVLYVGSLTGFFIAFFTFLRFANWWTVHLTGGVRALQGDEGWRFWLCAYVGLFGLVLLLGSLLLARVDIRVNVNMRRLLYGYNALCTGALVLAVLVMANVMVAVAFPSNVEWTEFMGMHSLSSQTRMTLEGLKDKVTVYVLLSRGQLAYMEVHDLLDNCLGVTNKLEVEYLSPDQDDLRMRDLAKTYRELSERTNVGARGQGGYARGLLVVYGEAPKGKAAPHAFIPDADLEEREFENRSFKGEQLLTQTIKSLSETTKIKIYISQGRGELRMDDADARNLIPTDRILLQEYAGIGDVDGRLRKDNYEVQGLYWSAKPNTAQVSDRIAFAKKTPKDQPEVPDDCGVLIIANPDKAYAKEVLEAIDRYMDRDKGTDKPKGKLMVVSSTPILESSKIGDDGMQEFCKKYGIEVGNDFLMRMPRDHVGELFKITATVPRGTKNEIAAAFAGKPFYFLLPRTVKPAKTPGAYQVDTILEVNKDANNDVVWAETDVNAVLGDPVQLLRDLKTKDKLKDKLSPDPFSVAVAVTDRDRKPRAVVLGDYTFISTDMLQKSPSASLNYDFFHSCMEWLADRKVSVIGVSPKKSGIYKPSEQMNKNYWRLVMLPIGLMVVGLAGVGAGIWIVRRK